MQTVLLNLSGQTHIKSHQRFQSNSVRNRNEK